MGNVYIEPVAGSDCFCRDCVRDTAAPVRCVVSQSAMKAALDTLGIKGDVVVKPGPAGAGILGGFAGPDEHGRWVVLFNDRTDEVQNTYDFTLWHELGHVLDTEQNLAKYPGLTWQDIDAYAQHKLAQIEPLRNIDYAAWYEAYASQREELFANEVAAKYEHIPLVARI